MMRSLTILSATAVAAMAAGYKIPETSVNATALSAAYVANAHGADAAYYNPAAMVYNVDANLLEIGATYIHLTPIDFAGTTGSYSSKKEDFMVPTLHFASKKLGDNNARVGLSIVVPAGLSKRWENPVPRASAEEFTLKTVEINPSVAVPVSDTVSLGAGFRIIHSSGTVKSTYLISREMEGDSIDYGYNLAVIYKPIPKLSVAATYRSNIDLNVEGNAKLYAGTSLVYNGDARVSVPSPAALNLAAAYEFESGTTVEAVFERTYWSSYKNLDFDYSVNLSAINPLLGAAFDNPRAKNWTDTNTYRLGLTQKYARWTAMAGIAYDETPVPESTLGYELPDSDAWIISLGGRYKIDEHWDVGMAALADFKQGRDVNNASIHGTFDNARAYLVSIGMGYRF